MSWAEPAANILVALSAWLLLPAIVRLLLGERLPEAQRRLGRTVILGIPFLALTLGVGDSNPPLIELPSRATPSSVDPSETELAPALPSLVESSRFGGQRRVLFVPPPQPEGERLDEMTPVPTGMGLAEATGSLATSSGGKVRKSSGWTIWGALLGVWALGVAVGWVRLLGSVRGLRGLERSWPPASPEAHERLRSVARACGYRTPIRLRVSESLAEAVAWGILRPSIAVPASWIRSFRMPQIEPLLRHEVAHLRYRDPLWRLLMNGARVVLWPHPLVWWLSRRDAVLAEYTADRWAIGLGHCHREYARLLSEVAAFKLHRSRVVSLAPSILGPRSQLEGRIRMILRTASSGRLRRGRLSSALIVSSAAFALACLVTHPLVGTCDPDDVDPVVQVAPDAPFVIDVGPMPVGPILAVPAPVVVSPDLIVAGSPVIPDALVPRLAVDSGVRVAPEPLCPPGSDVRADLLRRLERQKGAASDDLLRSRRLLAEGLATQGRVEEDERRLAQLEAQLALTRNQLAKLQRRLQDTRPDAPSPPDVANHKRLLRRLTEARLLADPKDAEQTRGLARVHGVTAGGRRAADSGRLDEAVELLRMVLEREGRLTEEELSTLETFLKHKAKPERKRTKSRRGQAGGAARSQLRSRSRFAPSARPGGLAPRGRAAADPEMRQMVDEMRNLRNELLELRQEMNEDRRRLKRALRDIEEKRPAPRSDARIR